MAARKTRTNNMQRNGEHTLNWFGIWSEVNPHLFCIGLLFNSFVKLNVFEKKKINEQNRGE